MNNLLFIKGMILLFLTSLVCITYYKVGYNSGYRDGIAICIVSGNKC